MNRADRRRQKAFDTKNQTNVKIIVGKPPCWDAVVMAFQINPIHAVFTYGDTIYNPSGIQLRDDIIEHEKLHMEQQDHSIEGAELWWGKFLRDVDFRIEQEARCYARQYSYLCESRKGHEERHRTLYWLAQMLSGPLYNNAITHTQAMDKIKKYSGVK